MIVNTKNNVFTLHSSNKIKPEKTNQPIINLFILVSLVFKNIFLRFEQSKLTLCPLNLNFVTVEKSTCIAEIIEELSREV